MADNGYDWEDDDLSPQELEDLKNDERARRLGIQEPKTADYADPGKAEQPTYQQLSPQASMPDYGFSDYSGRSPEQNTDLLTGKLGVTRDDLAEHDSGGPGTGPNADDVRDERWTGEEANADDLRDERESPDLPQEKPAALGSANPAGQLPPASIGSLVKPSPMPQQGQGLTVRRADGSVIEQWDARGQPVAQPGRMQPGQEGGPSSLVPSPAVLREYFNRANQSIPQVPGGPRNPLFAHRQQAVLDLYRHMTEEHMREARQKADRQEVSLEAQRKETEKGVEAKRQEEVKAAEHRLQEAARLALKQQGGSLGRFHEANGAEAPAKLDKMYQQGMAYAAKVKKEWINQEIHRPGGTDDVTGTDQQKAKKRADYVIDQAKNMFTDEVMDKIARGHVQKRLDFIHPPDTAARPPGDEAPSDAPGAKRPQQAQSAAAQGQQGAMAPTGDTKEQQDKFNGLIQKVMGPQGQPQPKPVTPDVLARPSSIDKGRVEEVTKAATDAWNDMNFVRRDMHKRTLGQMAEIVAQAHREGRPLTVGERKQYEELYGKMPESDWFGPTNKERFKLK